MPPFRKIFQAKPMGGLDGSGGILKPFWSTSDGETVKLYHGHVVDVLARLPEKSVHCCVTSPPYWNLRDYNTGRWEGGDENCDHVKVETGYTTTSTLGPKKDGLGPTNAAHLSKKQQYKSLCTRCGAKRIDQQIGSEPSPDCVRNRPLGLDQLLRTDLTEEQRFEAFTLLSQLTPYLTKNEPCGHCFVCTMVNVFRGVRRVLRDDGTCWLNLGDTYGGGKVGRTDLERIGGSVSTAPKSVPTNRVDGQNHTGNGTTNLPPGNLVGIPWRVALALQADGWVLRQDIIWNKPSPMPESVRNRCTKAHEYIFLLTKSSRYYYDAEAIKERSEWDTPSQFSAKYTTETALNGRGASGNQGNHKVVQPTGMSNKRSVWRVSHAGYPGAHFATYPPKLIEPCILAGTSAKGCCSKCGTPWKRIVEEDRYATRPGEQSKYIGTGLHDNETKLKRFVLETKTVGWEPGCTCFGRFEKVKTSVAPSDAITMPGHSGNPRVTGYADMSELSEEVSKTLVQYVSDIPLNEHPVIPCTVLDPFIGSGTSCIVSLQHGRRSIGIDLSEKYLLENAIPRVEGKLRALGKLDLLPDRPKPPRVALKGVSTTF